MRSKNALKNIIVSFVLQVIVIICGFIVPRMIIESYGSNVNGLLSSITQFLAYITLLESGIGPVIKSVLYKPIAEKNKQQIENILKASETFFKTISYIFAGYIAVLTIVFPIVFQEEFDVFFTASLVLIISITTFAEYFFGVTYQLYLQAEQKKYITSVLQIVTTIVNAIMVIALIKLGASIQIVKIATVVIYLLRPILQNVYVKRKYNINIKNGDSKYKLEQKWDGLAQHIAAVVHTNTDITILTFFAELADISIYTVYYIIVAGIKNLVEAFTGGIGATFGDMIAKGEKENLKESFKIYETFYYTLTTIVFACTIVLIVPFVKIYTMGITDANYIRPAFGVLIVLAEFMHSIRLPYSTLTLAAGHFKETKKGAWYEAIINIVISVVFVIKYGLVGVAIGTLVAMFIRTIEFMLHASKNILSRKITYALKRLLVIALQVICIVFINKLLFDSAEVVSYLTWFYYAIKVGLLAAIVILSTNFVLYKDEIKGILEKTKNVL